MFSELPSIHVAILHFPLALVPIAVGLEAVGLAWRDRAAEYLAASFWLMAALATSVTWYAGGIAADQLVNVPATVQPNIGEHADWAYRALIIVWVLAVMRGAALWGTHKGQGKGVAKLAAHGVSALAGLGLLFVLVGTAERGGRLVYKDGLAVTPRPCPVCESPAAATPPPEGGGIQQDADGMWAWTPGSGAIEASGITVVAGNLTAGEQAGSYQIAGRVLLALPMTLENVQVNAWIDSSNFKGTVGVLHHIDNEGDAGVFWVNTDGEAALIGSMATNNHLDDGSATLNSKSVLSVSAAGSHLKGLVQGKVVTHGHGPARAPGRVGVLLDGTGSVRLSRIEAVPLKGH